VCQRVAATSSGLKTTTARIWLFSEAGGWSRGVINVMCEGRSSKAVACAKESQPLCRFLRLVQLDDS
jgi:hypothetical protein